jgi:hypothetical protein
MESRTRTNDTLLRKFDSIPQESVMLSPLIPFDVVFENLVSVLPAGLMLTQTVLRAEQFPGTTTKLFSCQGATLLHYLLAPT